MITRWLHRNYRFSSSLKFWFRRKFTPAGLIVLVATLISAGIGVDTSQALAYQFSTLLWMLLLFSVCWSIARAPRFNARRLLPRSGTAGQPLHYKIVVTNPGRRRQSSVSLMEDLGDPRPTYAEFSGNPEPGEFKRNFFDRFFRFYRWMWLISQKQIATAAPELLPDIDPHQSVELSAQLLPMRRGRLDLNGFLFTVPDPFGLCRSHSRLAAPEKVLILPKRYRIPKLELGGSSIYQPGGLSLSHSLGQSEEFISVREYRRGDPLRHIHWKNTSKTGKLIVKEFQSEFFARHALVLDTFLTDANQGPVFEEAVSVAASFASSIDTQESMLDLVFAGPNASAPALGQGEGHLRHSLELLATVQPATSQVFEELEQKVMRQIESVSGCICVFVHWDQKRKDLVEHLSTLGIPILSLLISSSDAAPANFQPPARAGVTFRLLQTGKIEEGLAQL